MSEFDLESYFSAWRPRIDVALERALAQTEPDPGRLREGMRYAVLLGGKRMRPLMVVAACEAAGGEGEAALPAGAALEMVHAYSLVHDDLPAMDDDKERRGKPTVHVVFGEAGGILIGDALLTRAFEQVARGLPEARAGQGVIVLARHAGIDGMVGGQALDLEVGQDARSLDVLEHVHAMKTGGLYAAAGALGALAAGADDTVVRALERFGLAFGIAFQHADDILDDDQASLRTQALARIDSLTEECLTIARGFGAQGRALHEIAVWVQTRAQRAATGDLRD